jgi:hypothetical protein
MPASYDWRLELRQNNHLGGMKLIPELKGKRLPSIQVAAQAPEGMKRGTCGSVQLWY